MIKVKLLKAARIRHKAGDIVEVTPDDYLFLTSVGAAVAVKEKTPEKKGTKKK